jgi:predicted acyl esterase
MRVFVRLVAVVAAALASGLLPASAGAAQVTQTLKFTASDGEVLHAYIGGEGSIRQRPTIVEFTPYAESCCPDWQGPDYNFVKVHARGTGLSTGSWGAVGPRDQQDVSEFLAWACRQPWSNGKLGLYGFSASAIAVYNSMHLPLDCVGAAALMAGTSDLYRDLLYPGGIQNTGPAAVVGAEVGGLLLGQGPGRLAEGKPVEGLQSGAGLLAVSLEIATRQTQDDFWRDRTQRPGPNTFPVLANSSFYDVEARGPFESFKQLRATNPGSKLRMLGAHDGFPAGTSPFGEYRRWFDRHLLGADNGIDREPPVRLLVGKGSRERLLAGDYVRRDGEDWPLPGTTWKPYFLDPAKTAGARSLNDGSLSETAPAKATVQNYPAVSSSGPSSDPNTTAATGPGASSIPSFTDMTLASPASLSYTTAPFARTVDVVGPAALTVHLASTAPEADVHAVIADVRPDGKAFPVGVGRLRTSFPAIDRDRSLIVDGEVVQPYGVYSAKSMAAPAQQREYHVEFWPVGNRFEAGHRLRLYLVGTSSYMLPGAPGVNMVSVGGATPSRLLIPLAPATAQARSGIAPTACTCGA